MERNMSIWTNVKHRPSMLSIKQLVLIIFMCVIIIIQQTKIMFRDFPHTTIGIRDSLRNIEQDVMGRSMQTSNSSKHQSSHFLQDSKIMWNGYQINCTTIHDIKIERLLGQGSRRTVYLGHFRGERVAVKTMSFDAQNRTKMRACVEGARNRFVNCWNFPYLMALNEILLHTQLKHQGFIQLLGYCVRDVINPPVPDQLVHKKNIVSVFEFGDEFLPTMKLNMKKKLQFAEDLCELLDYLEHSPLGSLYMKDLNVGNVLMHAGHLKLSDIDRITASEADCTTSAGCSFGVTCNNGTCVGQNAKAMMEKVQSRFFPLLFSNVSTNIATDLGHLQKQNATASYAKQKLQEIVTRL